MDDKIEALIKEAVAGLNYEEIILFGSRARGDFSKKSDYDLLLIMKKSLSIKEKMRLLANLRKELAVKGVDADIIIKSREEVNYYKGKIGNVVRTALREGVAI